MNSLESQVYRRAVEAGLSGGLTEVEAEQLATPQLDYGGMLIDEANPRRYTAVTVYLDDWDWDQEIASGADIKDAYSFIDYLDGVISAEKGMAERVLGTINDNGEKEQEYFLRTLYTLSESVDQELIDESVRSRALQEERDVAVPLAQYIDQVLEIVEDEEVVEEVYSTISEYEMASSIASMKVPVDELPDSVQDTYTEDLPAVEIPDSAIVPRLRNMRGAGQCKLMDWGHKEGLLLGESADQYPGVSEIDHTPGDGYNPEKDSMLVMMDDQLVGSIKQVGDESMLGLQNVTSEGKLLVEKGRGYRISYNVFNELENTEVVDGWRIVDLDRLEIKPIRLIGDHRKTKESHEEFIEMIDHRLKELPSTIIE